MNLRRRLERLEVALGSGQDQKPDPEEAAELARPGEPPAGTRGVAGGLP